MGDEYVQERQESASEEEKESILEEDANPQKDEDGHADGNDKVEEEEVLHFSGLKQDQYGIWTLESFENFAQVLKKEEDDPPHGLLLALLYTYSESCQADHDPWLM